jgi:hypothetical protein
MTPPVSFQTLPVQQQKQTEIADLLRKHGGKTGEELKAEGKQKKQCLCP